MGWPTFASPITWMSRARVASKVSGLTGTQPVSFASPASMAIRAADCGGMTLPTSILCFVPSSVSKTFSWRRRG